MSVYHQMGHNSFNLILEEELSMYKGAILSPVNDDEEKIAYYINKMRQIENFEIIFDSQLYYPRTEREGLRRWSYFPSDVDTADISNESWWNDLSKKLIEKCKQLNCQAACSPANDPKTYPIEYYSLMINVGNYFSENAIKSGILPIQTLIVGLGELINPNRPELIASIASQSITDRIYLVFVTDKPPRRELSNFEELKAAMRLINLLKKAEMKVIVGFSSSDMVLWKASGADSCATGKFFNLRRFTKTRFDEPSTSGLGQLPYLFEESLLAFLREYDVLRLAKLGLLSNDTLRNPYTKKILKQLEVEPSRAWLALSWRQYMYAFADLEHRIDRGEVKVIELLQLAESQWKYMHENHIFMEEPKNNGEWIKSWVKATQEFRN